jgi:PhnB protein
MTSLTPHLSFNGACADAFNFYKSVFGGEFAAFFRYDATSSFQNVPDADKRRVMHAELRLTEQVRLLGCDLPLSDPPAQFGNNLALVVSFATDDETRRVYGALSAGGKIGMPLEKTFFASLYAVITDKFGVNWGLMSAAPFNCPVTGEAMPGMKL